MNSGLVVVMAMVAVMLPSTIEGFLGLRTSRIERMSNDLDTLEEKIRSPLQLVPFATPATKSSEGKVGEKGDDVELLWAMAGNTNKRKRQRNRKKGIRNISQEYSIKNQSYRKPVTTVPREKGPTISKEEIDSIKVLPSKSGDSATTITAEVSLVNGTKLSVNPKTLHQTDDNAIWMSIRAALDVTASEFSAVLGTSYFTSRETLMNIKSGKEERAPVKNIKACEWGLRMEPRALAQYCQITDNNVTETGLHIRNYDEKNGQQMALGASPDGLVVDSKDGSKGLLEIKCLWGRRNKKELPQFDHCPSRFYDQIQGQMAICDRDWCDLMMYIPPSGFKNRKNYCILRIEKNQTHWENNLFPALESFCDEVNDAKAALATTDE